MSILPTAVSQPIGVIQATTWIDPATGMQMVASPAAMSPTSWDPNASMVVTAPPAGRESLLDAIADAILGTPAPAPAAAAMVGAQQVAVPPVVAAPPAVAPAPAPAAAPVPDPVAAPPVAAPPVTTTTVVDPTTTNLPPAAAIAGYNAGTGRTAATAGAGVGTAHAKRVGTELWAGVKSPRAVHVTQVPSKFNTAPAANNKDCGPTSVVMTLKLLGIAIPGVAAGAAPQKLINRVRTLAGSDDSTTSTTNQQLEVALAAAGAKTTEVMDFAGVKASVLAGKPVILNGNPRNSGAYGPRFSADRMTPYNGAHWIVVSGFDTKTGQFIINDPLSKAGAVKVSPEELDAYRGGSLGISVEP